jgi:hypothetical protein
VRPSRVIVCKVGQAPLALHTFHVFSRGLFGFPVDLIHCGTGAHPYRLAFEVVFVYNKEAELRASLRHHADEVARREIDRCSLAQPTFMSFSARNR